MKLEIIPLTITILLILILILIYGFYQLKRNQKIYKIRIKWIETDDSRWDKYTYKYMLNPNLKNWFGIKFPNEKDFKI